MTRRFLIFTGNFFFRFRNVTFPLLMLVAVATLHPRFPMGSERVNDWSDLVGCAVALIGQALRILTIGYKYIVRGGRRGRVFANDLVVSGVFGHSRNPMYVGNFLIFLGIAIMAHAPLLYLVGIPFVVYVYAALIAAEEHYLHGKFGAQFEDYTKRVNRLLPDFRGFSRTVAGQTFQWKHVMAKEYGTAAGLLYAMIVVRGWSIWCIKGDEGRHEALLWAWAVIPVTLAYITVRILKKSHRLE